MNPRDELVDAIRPYRDVDFSTVVSAINESATAYRGVVPPDCYHDPYMSDAALRAEIAAGVEFCCYWRAGRIAGVMGLQRVRNVELIRHAYVRTEYRKQGVGTELMAHLRAHETRQIMVGTWAAAHWAIRFYERHGFRLVPERHKTRLLQTYWSVSARQIETSVVLASPLPTDIEVERLLSVASVSA